VVGAGRVIARCDGGIIAHVYGAGVPHLVQDAHGVPDHDLDVLRGDSVAHAHGHVEVVQHKYPHACLLDDLPSGRVLLLLFDLELHGARCPTPWPVPVIASGGVGTLQHLVEGVTEGHADAVLAASIFHFGEYSIRQAKEAMQAAGVEVRL